MTNKYKKEISKYKIADSTKEKIYTKLEQPKIRKFKIAYSVLTILLVSIISVGIVYAKDIKEFIESWGKMEISYRTKEGEKKSTNLEKIAIIETKLDDYVFPEEIYNNLSIVPNDYPLPEEGVTTFSNKNISEIKKELGIEILGIENLKYEETYTEITKERKIGSISIKSNEFIVKCGKRADKESCSPLATGYKGFAIRSEFKTKNSQNDNEYEFSYDTKNSKSDFQIQTFNKIGNLKVEGISYQLPIIENDETTVDFATDMYFNYKNIRYEINATNLTQEEIIKILADNLN